MSTNMVLRGGHVLDLPDGTWHTADVLIEDGTITAVGAGQGPAGAPPRGVPRPVGRAGRVERQCDRA